MPREADRVDAAAHRLVRGAAWGVFDPERFAGLDPRSVREAMDARLDAAGVCPRDATLIAAGSLGPETLDCLTAKEGPLARAALALDAARRDDLDSCLAVVDQGPIAWSWLRATLLAGEELPVLERCGP